MDFKELMKFADTADTVNAVVIYAFFGVAALLLILLILWGIMKLSNFISRKKGKNSLREELTDEEQLFGD